MAFVKFSRGLTSQYNALPLEKKDADTLYLVYDSTSSKTGSLYLGNKLISSVGTSNIELSDLTNVSIPDEVQDGMLLQYIAQTETWEARPLEDVLANYHNSNTGISIVDDLDNIENKKENDLAIQGRELFIYDGTEWKPLTVSDLENRLSILETKVGDEGNTASGRPATGLYKKLEELQSELQAEISSTLVNAQHLRYKVVESIASIDLTNEDDTKNTVFLVPKNSDDIRENDGYDEYLVNDGVLEKIGSWDADLTNYVETTDDRLLDDEQKKKLDSIGLVDDQAVIQSSQVANLQDFIDNNQFIKSVAAGTFNVTSNGCLELVSVPSSALTNYISSSTFNSTVGDLTQLTNRVSANSTLVDEINTIKASVIWQELTQTS